MSYDYKTLMWDETEALGELLTELSDEEFDAPTLCDGWRVRDIIGHMELGHTQPMTYIMKEMVRYRFDMTKGSFELSKRWGDDHSVAELREIFDRELVHKHTRNGIAKTIRYVEGFLDHTIHNQDIRRPLGKPREIPEHRLTGALEALPKVHTPLFSTRSKLKGLRLQATDVDFTLGDGPVVRGKGEAIVMAAAGRVVALDELDGDGVPILTERIKTA